MKRLSVAGFIALAGLSVSVSETDICACAPVSRPGESIQIEEESALIIWDAKSKTQHFIRRAQFNAKAKDFGFIVPTPTRPEISEVKASIFGHLEALTRPPPRVAPQPKLQSGPGGEVRLSAGAPTVTVVESVTVAGLDAVVLTANDAKALNSWLSLHGYASSPELQEWFKPYIKSNWLLTAFKISKRQSTAARTATSAVRMSFQTDEPFFPYREPSSPGSAPRALEVYFIAGERVEGRRGDGIWPGQTLWAQPLSDESSKELLERVKLPGNTVPSKAWLTRFLDQSSPRPGSDEVYFSRARDQAPYMDADKLYVEIGRKADAARAADAWALLEQGRALEDSGNIKGAVRLYLRAIRAGEFEAAKRLGDIYKEGKGEVPKDHMDSLRYYAIAKQNGIKIDREQGK